MSWLEIHVFGSNSKGEGVILRLPDGGFAVIDSCFRGSIDNPLSNPMVDFLHKRGVSELAFACLTHPHEDHYFGLSQIIEAFPPTEFWTSAAMDPNRLKRIILAETLHAKRHGDTKRQNVLQELRRIEETWKHLTVGRSTNRRRKRGLVSSLMYPGQLSRENSSVEIWAFSPCADELERYEKSLHQCFDVSGTFKDKVPPLRHNDISLGLLVDCKTFSVVLGGDVEARNWMNALHAFSHSRFSSRLVKVSHHGSPTGSCENLWSVLAAGARKTIAIVTGFQPCGLPRADVLDHIASYADEVFCTHQSSLPSGYKTEFKPRVDPVSDATMRIFFDGEREPAVATLRAGFDNLAEITSAEYGRCSFYLSFEGVVESTDVEFPACKTSRRL